MRILVVEDEKRIADFLCRGLEGAGYAVDAAAKEFVSKHGANSLPKVAKMHFRTAMRAQGLSEPPKVEWHRHRLKGPARPVG